MVILGHWLLVAPYLEDGQLVAADALSLIPWTRWLTWLVQVMPVFFLVGGYVNGLGWQAAQRRQNGYASWLAARLRRLVSPVLPVLAIWTLIGLAALQLDADPALLKVASQFALLPAWFLVVYILVILLAPLAYRAWQRYRFASFWTLAAAAALVDLLALGVGWRTLGWLNYLFVWLAIHQLGFAWQAGRMGVPRRCLLWAAADLELPRLRRFDADPDLGQNGGRRPRRCHNRLAAQRLSRPRNHAGRARRQSARRLAARRSGPQAQGPPELTCAWHPLPPGKRPHSHAASSPSPAATRQDAPLSTTR